MTQPSVKKPRKKPPQLAVVDQNGCTGCEICIAFCPVDCIEVVPGPNHPTHQQLVEIDLDRCIGCKLCVKYCPWETIYMIPFDQSPKSAEEWTLRSIINKDWVKEGIELKD